MDPAKTVDRQSMTMKGKPTCVDGVIDTGDVDGRPVELVLRIQESQSGTHGQVKGQTGKSGV